jgi:hypothetical protein
LQMAQVHVQSKETLRFTMQGLELKALWESLTLG